MGVILLLTAAVVASLTACAGSAGSAKSSARAPDPGSTQAPETKNAEESTKAANTDKAGLVLKNGLIQTMTDGKNIAQAGIQIHVHAIGDGAVKGTLEAAYVGGDRTFLSCKEHDKCRLHNLRCQ